MTSRASCAVGSRVQVADMFAQVGTCEPVAVGDGDWLTSADGDAVRAAEAVGDVWTAALPVVSQAAATASAAAPFGTGSLRHPERWPSPCGSQLPRSAAPRAAPS